MTSLKHRLYRSRRIGEQYRRDEFARPNDTKMEMEPPCVEAVSRDRVERAGVRGETPG